MASFITLPDSRKLSYSLDSTPSDGPIVLLANSLAAPFPIWDHLVPLLSAQGFRTLRYDQPGHGTSDAPNPLAATTFDLMVDDAKALLDTLAVHKLHAWVGDSMGAVVGVLFAVKNPGVVSRLAVCDTIDASPAAQGAEDPFGPRISAAREAGSMDAAVEGTMERWFGRAWMEKNEEEASRVRGVMRTTQLDGFEACCRALMDPTLDLKPILGKVGASVDRCVCVVGANDGPLPEAMKSMREKIEEGFGAAGKSQKVELAVIPDAGHVPFIDNLDGFVKVIVPFLKD